MRVKFEKNLAILNSELIAMSELVEVAIDDSINALIQKDLQLAEQVIEQDKEINRCETKIESVALNIMLLYQPVAKDFRIISTALKIVSDLERIGDQARDICSVVLQIKDKSYKQYLIRIPQMASYCKKMVSTCIDSFVNMDFELAKTIFDIDDKVDALFKQIKDDMIKVIKEKPELADEAIYLVMVAKYFEKIGDHAENIAKWILFIQTGKHNFTRIL